MKWDELCDPSAKHCVEKYLREEVETGWRRLWNKTNTGDPHGTREEFHKPYDYSVEGVRRALPVARIGGPGTAGGPGGGSLDKFLHHCVSSTAKVTRYRIDEIRSDALTLWKALGDPQKPTTAQ